LTVKAEHVLRACDVLATDADSSSKPRGLVVMHNDIALPAKAVLRLAYCLANDLPSGTTLKFASGEGSLKMLKALGVHAKRLDSENTAAESH
jgi:hypothetical protein